MNQTNEIVPLSSNTEQTGASKLESPEEIRSWLQDELRLAKAYWQQQIQPFINERKLRDLEFEVARRAHERVKETIANARQWNAGKWPLRGNDGKQFPIPPEEFAALEKFRNPEPFLVDKSLKPETLAVIAAPMIGKRLTKLLPSEAVRIAHDLLTAAQDYLDTSRKAQTDRFKQRTFTCITVSFEEIEQSNKKESGQLPLLPPVQTKRNQGKLELPAIKAAVRDFYETRTKLLPQENEATKNDCLLNSRIPLADLCEMRWKRFKSFWQKQQHTASHRKPRQKKPLMESLPKSAATSPIVAGRSKK